VKEKTLPKLLDFDPPSGNTFVTVGINYLTIPYRNAFLLYIRSQWQIDTNPLKKVAVFALHTYIPMGERNRYTFEIVLNYFQKCPRQREIADLSFISLITDEP